MPDPRNWLQDKHQLEMLEAFGVADYTGLQEYIVEKARSQVSSESNPPRSYEMIVEDWDNGIHHIYELLRLLPPAVIRSLIANTLPYDIIHDSEVKRFYEAHMAINESSPCAGIYAQWIAHARDPMIAHDPEERGKFLSSTQVETMLHLAEGYLDNEPASKAVNDSIDRTYNQNWRSSSQRAKPAKDETLRKAREWIDIVRRQYCTGIDPSKANEAFVRVPMEVGWAHDIKKRIGGHNTAAGTPILLYLVHAIKRKTWTLSTLVKNGALVFPVPVEEDTPLYKIAEILGSLLCSSYHFHGGYNTHLAGDSNTTMPSEDDPVWYTSEEAYLSRLKWGHLDDERNFLNEQHENLARARELPAMRKAHADEKAAYEERVEALNAETKKLDKLRLEYDQLKAKAATLSTGPVAKWLSPAYRERLNIARQRQRVWEYLDMGESHPKDEVETAAAEIDKFDPELVADVIEKHAQAHARVRQQIEDALERRREEKEREEENAKGKGKGKMPG